MSGFQGFPPELFTFFEGLEKDNSKAYWEANKTTWAEKVRDPMKALLTELDGEFPPLRMFRPNRDVRFSKDKSPSKLWVGATSESRAVGDSTGRRFAELTTQLAAISLPVTCGAQPPLKTSPPGYPKTHPRAELLCWKGAAIIKEYAKADWMSTAIPPARALPTHLRPTGCPSGQSARITSTSAITTAATAIT